jgi:hypothetical protein
MRLNSPPVATGSEIICDKNLSILIPKFQKDITVFRRN